MTIPSRPAPPPPQSQQNSGGGHNAAIKLLPPPPAPNTVNANIKEKISNVSKSSSIARHFPTARTRYAPITNWEDKPFSGGNSNIRNENKKIPPPRPPPPKIFVNNGNCLENTALKKPGGPPQSVNVLSNLFGRKKTSNVKKPILKIPLLPLTISNNQNNQQSNLQSQNNTDFQLISFDSPPSSPTLTQKSNSDCVSVDSFSSDSNFSSPHNGSISQAESGFEDDFISPIDPFESMRNENSRDTTQLQITFNDFKMTQPVRNINAINRTQNDNPLCNGKNILPPPPILTAPTIIRPKILQSSTNNFYSTTQNKVKLSEIPSISKTDSQESDFCLDDSYPSLPMPNCPPPPPPPLEIGDLSLDSIELLEDDFEQPSYGIALYDFEGLEDGDLSLKANEKVYLLEQLNDEWYMGRNKRGCEGIFPRNYIDVKIPLKNPLSTSQDFKSSTLVNTKTKVLYNFNAETSDDLSLKENEYVKILYKINDDWLFGEIDGRCGQFPANFVENIPKNLPRTKTS